ncbi:hypothetical protein SERLA73DRAFT_69943 [Serpula lacrymans var. lacrymans S7.3]|uniref:Uncharacterized protein n=2 Tax=Serpula lacrymans var. lacrymans TaxID=341189 RepID=F8PLF4_SERL3|nr:uncharacterized protein SERLADRAFT_434021 [Serpula lacrymans var. lacrymans S7.9]EGO02436.1 hypothetical protein SERLA73DRAFT_69943 [Serpula lacrymans var. lacrymans S7.3]EGO28166.1 hypothetical protein SERLADRAFT_434021 [Serpula lacrymans var. lacrymans S7.9]
MTESAIYKAYHAKIAGQNLLQCAVQKFAWKVMELSMTKAFYRKTLGGSRKALTSSVTEVKYLQEYMIQKGLSLETPDFHPAPIKLATVVYVSAYSDNTPSDDGLETDTGNESDFFSDRSAD